MEGVLIATIPATFAGMCVYALVKSRRSLAEALRVRAMVADVPPTTVRDAPRSGRVHLTGRVSGAGGAVVMAPFTADSVLWAHATARTNIGQVMAHWTPAVETMVLDDGSGATANIALAGATVRMPDVSIPNGAQIAVFMTDIGRSPGSGEFYWQAMLLPGETVSVIATASGPGGYRESANTINLSAEAGELLVIEPDAEANTPDKYRRHISGSIFGIVLFGAITAALVIHALR